MTESEACTRWVDTFNEIPTSMFREWAENYGRDNDEYLQEVTVFGEDEEPEDTFPMWGWMWSFPTKYEEDMVEELAKEVSELGFRIYDTEYGHYIGIDGAGYDFYEKHWLPLYRLFGMHWHDEEEAEP